MAIFICDNFHLIFINFSFAEKVYPNKNDEHKKIVAFYLIFVYIKLFLFIESLYVRVIVETHWKCTTFPRTTTLRTTTLMKNVCKIHLKSVIYMRKKKRRGGWKYFFLLLLRRTTSMCTKYIQRTLYTLYIFWAYLHFFFRFVYIYT